jgi:hypothetical protein
MPSADQPEPLPKLYSAIILGVSVLLPALLLVRVIRNFHYQFFLAHVEGIWLACANDFLHGVLYRPLFSTLGYGGTRYFPLYFILTSAFSRIFGTLETSALAIAALSVLLLVLGCYVLLRRLGVSWLLSVGAGTAILAPVTTQQALLHAKGDGLAAMLNVWGLLFCVDPKWKRAWTYLAALCFTLAFAAKFTSIFGVAAVFLGWILSRRYKDAIELALATSVGYVVVLGGMYFGSDGRVFGIFRACAAASSSISFMLQAPLHTVLIQLEDPITLLFLVPAVVFGLRAFWNHRTHAIPLYFLLAVLVTVVIFGTPGTELNHLIDLQVASVLLFVLSVSRLPEFSEIGTGLLAMSLFISCFPSARDFHGDFLRPRLRQDAERILASLPASAEASEPVLAENPLLVLKTGKTPYLLDPFMFRVFVGKHPELGRDLWDRIKQQRFPVIVLEHDPRTPEGKIWYTEMHFGGEFLEDLNQNYDFSHNINEILVYLPKRPKPVSGP